MKFSNYKDFDDFIKKNNMTLEEGLKFLDKELEKRRSGKNE